MNSRCFYEWGKEGKYVHISPVVGGRACTVDLVGTLGGRLSTSEWVGVHDESRSCTCFNPRRALINAEDNAINQPQPLGLWLTKWLWSVKWGGGWGGEWTGRRGESWFKLRVWTGTGWTERNELVGIRKGSGCGRRDALGNWRNPRWMGMTR